MKGNQGSVRRGRRWRIMTWVLAALLVAAMSAPLAAAAPAVQTTSLLRIGYLGPAESPTAHGAQLAIDQINGAGGISAPGGATYQLELVSLAGYPSVATLSDAVEELLQAGVSVLLGPDTNALITPDTIELLVGTGLPVLTGATGDALTEVDTANYLFRTRAPERIYSYAIADYLLTDLSLGRIAIVQTEPEFSEAASNFESVLANRGVTPADKVILPAGDQLLDEAAGLVSLNPQALVMWGGAGEAADLLKALRDAGWTGVFAFRGAQEAGRMGVFPRPIVEGILGMDAWSYGTNTDLTRTFLRDYVIAFGEVPTVLSVASYDAIWFLRSVIRTQGVDPTALRTGLLQGGPLALVHGTLRPADFGNGDLARTAVIYALGKYGGPEVLVVYDDVQRLTPGQPVVEPTAVPVTPEPPTPVIPTATLEGVWAQVNVNTLNVRSGPGFDYQQVAQVRLGERYRIIGALADRTWLMIDYGGVQAWVNADFVDVLGDLALVPVVAPPVTPTPAATPTITPAPFPDIVIDTVLLAPAQPVVGQPFIATVTVRNAGGAAAGSFAIAATWEPGSVFTSAHVEGLAPGQSIQVPLSGTLSGTPGVYQTAVVADLNQEVAEFDETNNTYTVTYQAIQ